MKNLKEITWEYFFSEQLHEYLLCIFEKNSKGICMKNKGMFYRINETEYNCRNDRKQKEYLNGIINACYVLGTVWPRYLCSMDMKKNYTPESQEFFRQLYSEICQICFPQNDLQKIEGKKPKNP